MEMRGIDPRAPRMQSECSTIWATPPLKSMNGRKKNRKEQKKKEKNSPTGIRTPVFHVTGEDTNQLYYWRSLRKGQKDEHKGGVRVD